MLKEHKFVSAQVRIRIWSRKKLKKNFINLILIL